MLASSVESVSEQPELLASSLQEPEEMIWREHPYPSLSPAALFLPGPRPYSLSQLSGESQRQDVDSLLTSSPLLTQKLPVDLFAVLAAHRAPQALGLHFDLGWLMD